MCLALFKSVVWVNPHRWVRFPFASANVSQHAVVSALSPHHESPIHEVYTNYQNHTGSILQKTAVHAAVFSPKFFHTFIALSPNFTVLSPCFLRVFSEVYRTFSELYRTFIALSPNFTALSPYFIALLPHFYSTYRLMMLNHDPVSAIFWSRTFDLPCFFHFSDTFFHTT